jgi:hypothetical protein
MNAMDSATEGHHTGASERRPLNEAVNGLAGSWVAVDRVTNGVKLAAKTPYELTAEIRRRHLKGVAVLRVREPDEPELVGLG